MEQAPPRRYGFSVLSWLGGTPRSLNDLLRILRRARERGLISFDVLAIARRAIESQQRQVRDVMVPRTQMQVLSGNLSLREALSVVGTSRHSRYPVVGASTDQIIGILLVKDLLSLLTTKHEGDIESQKLADLRGTLLRAPLLVPESKRLHSLLAEFRIQRYHMAVVMDEYGGTAGVVTLEDALEEIIGDILDEHDESPEDSMRIQQLEDRLSIDALTKVEDFNEYSRHYYGAAAVFVNGDFDTIGGIVTNALGHVPAVGEELQLQDFYITVLAADSRHATQLSIRWVGTIDPESEYATKQERKNES